MPLFMDVHQKLPEGATANDVAGAHEADLRVQNKFQVNYVTTGSTRRAGRCSVLSRHPTPKPPRRVTGRHTG